MQRRLNRNVGSGSVDRLENENDYKGWFVARGYVRKTEVEPRGSRVGGTGRRKIRRR